MSALVSTNKDEVEALKAHCDRIARSGLVPEHFSKNPAAIYTAISMAKALGEVPETLMQHIYFVSGRAGLSAAYMLSRLQRTHAIRGTVRYETEGKGDHLSVRAVATDGETGETVAGPYVSMAMAKAEGWARNTKWQNMPEVMLRKRAVAFLARDHYPGALMGFLTHEEAEDIGPIRSAPVARVESGGFLAAATSDMIDDETGEILAAEEVK